MTRNIWINSQEVTWACSPPSWCWPMYAQEGLEISESLALSPRNRPTTPIRLHLKTQRFFSFRFGLPSVEDMYPMRTQSFWKRNVSSTLSRVEIFEKLLPFVDTFGHLRLNATFTIFFSFATYLYSSPTVWGRRRDFFLFLYVIYVKWVHQQDVRIIKNRTVTDNTIKRAEFANSLENMQSSREKMKTDIQSNRTISNSFIPLD